MDDGRRVALLRTPAERPGDQLCGQNDLLLGSCSVKLLGWYVAFTGLKRG